VEKVPTGILSLKPNQFSVRIGERAYIVETLDDQRIQVDGKAYNFSFREISPGVYSLLLDSAVFEVVAPAGHRNGDVASTDVVVNGIPVGAVVDDHRSLLKKGMLKNRSHASGKRTIRAPMPGKVVKVEVKAGDQVIPGTGLIILEAMKMENEIKSTGAGVVEEVRVSAGMAVEKDEPLMSIHQE